MTSPLPECPTPFKRKHPTKHHATQAMSRAWRRARHGGALPTRVYLCPCGAWHLTSKPDRRSTT